MEQQTHREPGMASPASYQITVLGRLPDQWGAWFNGSTIRVGHGRRGSPHTTMTCPEIDQAQLLGILNRLNSLNLALLEVILLE
jgi:hypothetical protein